MCRELARELGEKGAIVFSDVEHVILKSLAILFCYNHVSFILLCSFFKPLSKFSFSFNPNCCKFRLRPPFVWH